MIAERWQTDLRKCLPHLALAGLAALATVAPAFSFFMLALLFLNAQDDKLKLEKDRAVLATGTGGTTGLLDQVASLEKFRKFTGDGVKATNQQVYRIGALYYIVTVERAPCDAEGVPLDLAR